MKKNKSLHAQPLDKSAPSGVLSLEAKLALTSGSLTALYALPQLAMAGPVFANTPLSIAMYDNTSVGWNVDGTGGEEFQLNGFFGFMGSNGYGAIELDGYATAALVQTTGQSGGQFQKLSSGFVVGNTLAPGYQFGNTNTLAQLATAATYSYGYAGPPASAIVDAIGFMDGGSGFFGFRFKDVAGIHYGWAELTITLNADSTTAAISTWCYGSDVGESVMVGSCVADQQPGDNGDSGNVPTPPIPSLVLLGMGAMGVQRWRARRKGQQAAVA